MTNTTDWLQIAKDLPVGHSTRAVCHGECGTGRALVINHDPDKYRCYCFRCGLSQFESKGYMTLEQLAHIKAMNEAAALASESVALPLDINYDSSLWPTEARMWLYKASIYGSVLDSARIGYSPELGRVILPVYKDQEVIYYQGRAIFAGQEPKYLNPKTANRPIWYGKQAEESDTIVVTEDILSAIRVGEVTQSCSILGTKLDTASAGALSKYRRVIIWLDGDTAGVEGALSISKTLGLVTDTRIVRTERDPKEYTNQQINEILKDHL